VVTASLIALATSTSCSDDGPAACDAIERERAALPRPQANEAWNDIDELADSVTRIGELDQRAAALRC
jgi:hypothetical protein